MAIIKIDERNVAVDVRAELEEFEWKGAKWSDTKLIACSPFRDEDTPSFFVRLEEYNGYDAGLFADSGASDDYYAKGGIIRLLSYLRQESEEETRDYLLDKYARREGTKRLLVPPRLHKDVRYRELDASTVTPAISGYLSSRGISEEAQKRAGTGRGPHKGYVALPWHTVDGRLLNVKYRATQGKLFFYEESAYPISKLVWGANSVAECDVLVIAEAEIDALSWRTAGFEAVATGHGAINEEQAEIILRLPAERYIVAGDKDLVGKRFNRLVAGVLSKRKQVATIDWGKMKEKDANDVLRARGADVLAEYGNNVTFSRIIKKVSLK